MQTKVFHQLESQLARVGSLDESGQLGNEMSVVDSDSATLRNRANSLLKGETMGQTETLFLDQTLKHFEHLAAEEHLFAFNHQIARIVGQRDRDSNGNGGDGMFVLGLHLKFEFLRTPWPFAKWTPKIQMATENKTETVIQSNESTIEEQPRYYFEDIEAHLDALLEREKKFHKQKWQQLLAHMMRNGIPIDEACLVFTEARGIVLMLAPDCEMDMSHDDTFYLDHKHFGDHCSPNRIMQRLGLPPVPPQCTKYTQTTLCVKDNSPAGQ